MYLKFGDIKIDNKEFHKSKKTIDINLNDTNKIVISDRFELDEDDKYYMITKMVNLLTIMHYSRPSCIIHYEMNGFIKYFHGNRKNMPFLSKDEEIIITYNKILEEKKFKSMVINETVNQFMTKNT